MIRHGDLVTIAQSGSYGKQCPALIVQSDLFSAHPSLSVLPITSELCNMPLFRIPVEPDAENALRAASEIMVDKITTIPKEKAGACFGHLDDATMLSVTRAMAVFFGIA